MKKILTLLIVIGSLFLINSCKKVDYLTARRYFNAYLDTTSYIEYEFYKDITDEEREKTFKEVENILINIEKEFSIAKTIMMEINKIDKSTLMLINERSGKKDANGEKIVTEVSEEFLNLLQVAIEIAKDTKSRFDPTIGALSQLWNISARAQYCIEGEFGYNEDYCKIPTHEEINKTLLLTGYEKIEIDEINKTVYLPNEGMKLDLGAIAKGYACDKVMDYLVSSKIYNYILVNLGGNVRSWGTSNVYEDINSGPKKALSCKNEASIVPVGIVNPFYDGSNSNVSAIMKIYEEGVTVVTSGINSRFIQFQGKTYHHILDSTTGYPVDNNIESVTIIGASSTLADAYATAFYALGIDEGINILRSMENYYGVIVTKDYKIYIYGDFNYQITKDITKLFETIIIE